MATSTGRRKTGSSLIVAVVVGIAATMFLPTSPAHAIGNNRSVSRSCGSNYVSSGYSGNQYNAWAQTTRESGDCTGQLSAGLRANNGFVHPRVYGTTSSAYASNYDSNGFGSGMHWGCNACNVTYS